MVAWSLLQVDNNYLQLLETAVGLKWWQTCGSSGQDKQASSNMLSFFIFWCKIQTLTPNNACSPRPSRLQVYRHTLWLGHVCNPRYAEHAQCAKSCSRKTVAHVQMLHVGRIRSVLQIYLNRGRTPSIHPYCFVSRSWRSHHLKTPCMISLISVHWYVVFRLVSTSFIPRWITLYRFNKTIRIYQIA